MFAKNGVYLVDELNYCMQTPQNTKKLYNDLVGNSETSKVAVTFGLFAPFDRQFVDGSLKIV